MSDSEGGVGESTFSTTAILHVCSVFIKSGRYLR